MPRLSSLPDYRPPILRVLDALRYWALPDRTVTFTNRKLAVATGISAGSIPAIRRRLVQDEVVTVISQGKDGTKIRLAIGSITPSYEVDSIGGALSSRHLPSAREMLLDQLLRIYAEGRLSMNQMNILRNLLQPRYGGIKQEWDQLLFALRPASRSNPDHQRAIVPETPFDRALARIDEATRTIREQSGQATNDAVVQLLALYTAELLMPRSYNRALEELLSTGLPPEEFHSAARAATELFRAVAARAISAPRSVIPSPKELPEDTRDEWVRVGK